MKRSSIKAMSKAHSKHVYKLNTHIMKAITHPKLTAKEHAELIMIAEYLGLIGEHIDQLYYIEMTNEKTK